MNKNKTIALTLAGVLAPSLAGCGVPAPSPSAALPTGTPVPAETPEPAAPAAEFSFADLRRLQFSFASGAGAWRTLLSIKPDGSFYGAYLDTDMGGWDPAIQATQYRCDFTGQFTQPVKVNDYTYSVGVAELHYEREAGTEEIAGGIHTYYTDPYGLEDAEEILIYLPGAPLAELPEEFLSWVWYYDVAEEELPFYALNNEVYQQGFGSYDWVESARNGVEWAEETAAEYEKTIQEDAALSQEELNQQTTELYHLWDIQLNELWAVLKQILPPEELEPLTAEELEWIAWKEEITRAGQEAAGGSLAVMLQARRGAELTRERVYVLLEYLDGAA